MSHKDIGMPESFKSKSLFLDCGRFDKGVVFCEYDRELSEGQSPLIQNMIYDKNMLRTRFGQESVSTAASPKGELHSASSEFFFGNYVFHIGTGLYTFDGENLRAIYDEVPDCKSFMFVMNSMLYVFFEDIRIFVVDKDFTVSENVIADTKIGRNAKYNLSSYTELEVPDNMMLFRVNVDYVEVNAGTKQYNLPTECDSKYPVIFTSIQNGTVSPVNYTVDGSVVTLDRALYIPYNISYVPAKGTKYRTIDKIFGCTAVCTYGGNSSGGTRVFFTGNPEYPGYYFYSELLSPLHIKNLSYDILGDGREDIVCLAKQKGDLVAFGTASVYKLTYSFDEYTGPNFIVSEISTGVGCDIPGSVKLIDNRLVFANSRTGVYIITASEYTDELSIRRISANINGNSGNGFLNEDASTLKNCISVDFARRYMLVCQNGNAYVWDYGNSPYVVGDNPLSSEKRLSWYFFDSIFVNTLFEISGKLFGTRSLGDSVDIVHFSDDCDTDFGANILCMYGSRSFDVGESFSKKTASEMYINAAGKPGTSLMIYLFADNVPILFENYVFDGRDEDGEFLRRLLYRIPEYEAYRFSFMLICTGGQTGLYDAAMRFSAGGIYYR